MSAYQVLVFRGAKKTHDETVNSETAITAALDVAARMMEEEEPWDWISTYWSTGKKDLLLVTIWNEAKVRGRLPASHILK